MVEFIKRNPAIEGFQRARRDQQNFDVAEQALSERRRRAESERNIDTIARQGFQDSGAGASGDVISSVRPRPSPTPVIDAGRAADLPGTGRFMLRRQDANRTRNDTLESQTQRREDDMEREAIKALAVYGKSGNPADFTAYQQLARRANLKLPDDQLRDVRKAGNLSAGMLLAERWYKADPAQTQAFLQAYIQSDGDMEAAIDAAGAPKANPNFTKFTMLRDGKQYLGLIDTKSGEITNTGVEVPASRAGGRDSLTAMKKDVLFMLETGIAASAPEAFQLLQQGKEKPMALWWKAYSATLKNHLDNFMPPEEAEKRAVAAADKFLARFGQRRHNAGAPPDSSNGTPDPPKRVTRGAGGALEFNPGTRSVQPR